MVADAKSFFDFQIIPFNVHDYGLVLADFILKMDQQLEHIGIIKAIGPRTYRQILLNLRSALKRFQVVADVVQDVVEVCLILIVFVTKFPIFLATQCNA